MPINPLNLDDRMNLVNTVDSPGEKGRRYESFKQWEIYQDRIKDYVINDLREQYDLNSVKEIPLVSSVNLSKRIVNQLSVVYKSPPERDWTELSDEQVGTVSRIYKDMRVNKKLGMSNRGYKLQDQSHLWVVPKNGRLILRVLKNHQITVIPDPQDPEEALAYIISSLAHDDFVDQDNDFTATGYKNKVDQFETSKEYDEKTAKKKWKTENREHFDCLVESLASLDNFDTDSVQSYIKGYISEKELSFGAILPIIRIAISGTMKGPDIFGMISLLGKEESVARLKSGIELIQSLADANE